MGKRVADLLVETLEAAGRSGVAIRHSSWLVQDKSQEASTSMGAPSSRPSGSPPASSCRPAPMTTSGPSP